MDNLVSISVRPAVAAKLEKLALLVGSVADAVERLLEHWESGASNDGPTSPAATNSTTTEMWRSAEGDHLPIGAQLEAPYKGKTFKATVERTGIRYAGKIYASPSAAGRAVKLGTGLNSNSVSTNGRIFWKLRDPSTGRLVTIAELNPSQPIDVAKVLQELRDLKPNAA